MNDDRREFLKKMAQGAVYAVPLIHSLAAPRSLRAQNQGGDTKDDTKGTSTDKNQVWSGMQAIEPTPSTGFSIDPPWSKPPGG